MSVNEFDLLSGILNKKWNSSTDVEFLTDSEETLLLNTLDSILSTLSIRSRSGANHIRTFDRMLADLHVIRQLP